MTAVMNGTAHSFHSVHRLAKPDSHLQHWLILQVPQPTFSPNWIEEAPTSLCAFRRALQPSTFTWRTLNILWFHLGLPTTWAFYRCKWTTFSKICSLWKCILMTFWSSPTPRRSTTNMPNWSSNDCRKTGCLQGREILFQHCLHGVYRGHILVEVIWACPDIFTHETCLRRIPARAATSALLPGTQPDQETALLAYVNNSSVSSVRSESV